MSASSYPMTRIGAKRACPPLSRQARQPEEKKELISFAIQLLIILRAEMQRRNTIDCEILHGRKLESGLRVLTRSRSTHVSLAGTLELMSSPGTSSIRAWRWCCGASVVGRGEEARGEDGSV
jgi:hypothetical protein